MKKLFVIFVILMLIAFTLAWGQEIVYTNQITVAWDAPTELDTGEPIPPEDIIEYEVWVRDAADEVTYIGRTSALEYTVTMPHEGTFDVGVQTVRMISTGEEVYSGINWSDVDDPVGSTPVPFVARFLKGVNPPDNLRVQ